MLFRSIDKCLKLLPLLYLKAQFLPATEFLSEDNPERFVTEESYEYIRNIIASTIGPKDSYLEVFLDDMQYSDNPIICFISEELTDIYQDIKDFISVYSMGFDSTMNDALAMLEENFKDYWSQKIVNVLRPLNKINYNSLNDEEDDENDDSSFSSSSNKLNDFFDNQRSDDDWDKFDDE